MIIFLSLIVFNVLSLIFCFKTKKFLYTVSPKKQWRKTTKEFDKNFKKLKELDLSNNYKLSSDYIY